MLERNVKRNTEKTGRNDADSFFAINYRNRFAHSKEFAALCEAAQSGFLKNGSKRRCAAIHDRNFRAININMQVVDAVGGKRREQVFNS